MEVRLAPPRPHHDRRSPASSRARWQKGKSGREEAGRFPQGHTADRRRVEIPAQAAWAAAPSGGSAAPTPPPRRRGAERLGRWSPRPAAEGRAAHMPQVLGRDGDDHTARGAASGSLSCSPGCGQVQRLAAQLPRADPPRERPRPPLFKGQQREEQATSPVASPRSAIGGVWVPGTVLGAGSRWRARWTQSL